MIRAQLLRFGADSTEQFCETETNFNSVERLLHYATELVQEAAVESTPELKPPPTWPSKGGIRLEDVKLRYRPDLPPVLSKFDLNIQPGESLGICGRTGASRYTQPC